MVGSSAADQGPRFEVAPARALLDTPLVMRVTGLAPAQPVTLRATLSRPAVGTWQSSADFVADATGVVDLRRDAPRAGSYAGVDGMALLWSMLPLSGPTDPGMPQLQPFTISLTAETAGTTIATATAERLWLADDVTVADVRERGLVGRLFLPPGSGPHPGVVVVGGSGGGLPVFNAAPLASRGFAVLALAYFNFENLPPALTNIPLEYFETALAWLGEQDRVKPGGVGVVGLSRGGELALLLGATFPQIRTVVGIVPSHVVWPGIGGSLGAPAWTHRGTPIPMMAPSVQPVMPSEELAALMPPDSFAPRARQALILAEEEARRFHQPAVSAEQLFLGMLREGTGMATGLLAALEVDLEAARTAIETNLPRGEASALGSIGVTPECVQVVAQARVEAKSLESPVIGQEHLLLAMLQNGGPVAAVLDRSGVSYDAVRAMLPLAYQRLRERLAQAAPIALTPGFLAQLEDEAAEARAAIPVERIQGPVLLISGKEDAMWPSALMADHVMARRAAHGHPYRDEHLAYDEAGHVVGAPPFLPSTPLLNPHPMTGLVYAFGGTAAGIARANADAWPRMLRFLHDSL